MFILWKKLNVDMNLLHDIMSKRVTWNIDFPRESIMSYRENSCTHEFDKKKLETFPL